MSILGWIGYGVGLLIVSFFGVGFGVRFGLASGGKSDFFGFLVTFVPLLGLIGGIYAKIALLDNIWLILALAGGLSLAIGFIVTRLTRPPNVEKLKAKGNTQGLIKALRYQKDEGVRRAAAWALGQVGDMRAVNPLIAAFKDKDYYVREAAARALRQIRDTQAVEPLMAALKNEDSNVREAAVEALVGIGHGAVERLVTALTDEDWSVRKTAIEALVQIGDARAVELLIAALEDRNWWDAAKALGKIGDPRAVEPLIAVLKREMSTHGRETALQALGQINDPRIVQILIVFITEKIDALEREENPYENCNIGKIAVTVLQKVLEARAPSVAENDLYAITRLKSAEIHVYGSTCFGEYDNVYQVSCLQLQQLARQELIRRGLKA